MYRYILLSDLPRRAGRDSEWETDTLTQSHLTWQISCALILHLYNQLIPQATLRQALNIESTYEIKMNRDKLTKISWYQLKTYTKQQITNYEAQRNPLTSSHYSEKFSENITPFPSMFLK